LEFEIYTGHIPENDEENRPRKYIGHRTYTGFPNQASDCLRQGLDWNEKFVGDKNEIYTLEIIGGPYVDCSLTEGDLLIIDRVMLPENGSIIVIVEGNECTLKRFEKINGCISLHSVRNHIRPIIFSEDEFQNWRIWGCVTYVIQKIKMNSYRRLSAINCPL
jgi:DNA polymerase V